jgi:hypothetical protein
VTTAATAFSVALSSLTTTTVTVRAKGGRNNYGEATYSGSGTSYAARIEKVVTQDASLGREDEVVEYRAYIMSTTLTVDLEDEVTFDDGLVRPLVDVDYRHDEHGQQSVILSVGRRRS